MIFKYTQQQMEQLIAENEALRKQLTEKEGVVSNLEDANSKLNGTISKLETELAWLRKKVFGKMSERFISSDPDARQLDIFGEQLTETEKHDLEKEAELEKELITRTITAKKPRTTRKDISMENLRIEETIIDPEGINLDQYVCIGSEHTDKLAFKPGEFYIQRITRRKYALKKHLQIANEEHKSRQTVVIALLPENPIHKCMADVTLLTEIIIQKYLYHIPFHRQIAMFTNLGVRISSSTMGDWFSQSCELLIPLIDLLRQRVLSSNYIQVDESTIPVIDNDKKRTVKGYLWVVRNPENGEVFFHYDRGSRTQKTAMMLLHNFNGAIQSDGYKVYERFEALDGKLMLGCWAHARRKFDEALQDHRKLATEALLQIQSLYAVEREADDIGATIEQRKELRKTKAYPILSAFEKWLFANYDPSNPQSRLAKAIGYTYSIYPKLSRYHLDGRYRIDNNLVENAIRPLAIGRKNYLFCGNAEAATRAAMIYSLLGTCKAAGVNPAEWLQDVLSKIHLCTRHNRNLEELLPHLWRKNQISID